MELAARRGFWRIVVAPFLALALLVGYVIYVEVGSGSPAHHIGAPAATHAPAVKKLTLSDLLLAASTAKSIHLEYDTVTGVASAVHTNHALVTSFQWGVTEAAPTVVGGGGGASKPKVAVITITKPTDKYSVPLLLKELKGQAVANAVLYFTSTTGTVATDYLEFDLKNVLITSYLTNSSGDVPTETIQLYFTAITMKAHFAPAAAQVLTFNLATNTTG